MARNNKIQVRRSSTPGESPSGLSAGEIGFNTSDGILYIGQSDTDPTDILYQKFPAVSGITVDGGQVVPTTDGKITILGGDGIGITRDAVNTDSITINSTVTYSWTYETGDPSSAGGAPPSTGSVRFKDYGGDAGFIVEFDDVDSTGRSATNFFTRINQEFATVPFFNATFINAETQETSTYVGGGQSDSYGCATPFCDQTTFYALDYNPGLALGGINFGSIISPGDLVTVEISTSGLAATSYPAGPQSGGIARSYGSLVVPSYGWTAGGAVPANDGDFGINALNQVLANTTQVYFHKTDLDGYDQRDRNLDLSALRSKRGHMTLVPYTSSRGFTAGAVTFTLGGTGSYNGTYYTLDVDEVLIETGTDGITNGTKFNVILDYVTDVPETEITGYVSSYNGLTGAVEGVSSVNGKTGDLDVVTGYTAQADTPASANTGDFWLETDTGDLFFYDGSAFIQISGADGITGPTGPTGPVGDYVESFNGTTGAVEGVSSFNGATGAVEGVSSVNGQTGDVDTPRYYTMNMPLGFSGGVIPTGMVTHSVQHVPESLELVACQLYVPGGIVNGLNNFNVSVKKTTTLSDSTANITSGATSVATVSVAGGGKAGANYYNTATLASPGPTAESGEWIFCDVINNSDNETQAVVMLKWQLT